MKREGPVDVHSQFISEDNKPEIQEVGNLFLEARICFLHKYKK